MAASWFPRTGRTRATPLRLIFLHTTTAAVLLRLVSATTSVPSSSSEVCPDETAACYDSPFCWDCVAQFADSSDFCGDLYPVLAVDAGTGGTDECEVASALYCCSFDASGQDCLGDEVTMDFFRCGLLEESGCVLSESPCSGVSDGTDTGLSTPAPAPTALSPTAPPTAPTAAAPDDSQDTPTNAPSTIMPTETITVTVPAPVEDVPVPSTPSPVDEDRDAAATSGAAGVFKAHSPSWERGSSWSSYYSVVFLVGAGPEVIPQKVVTVEGGKKPHSHKKRDVDVLSNRFLEKHEERMAEEKRFLRETAEEKYRRTHDYNIVAGKYYDQDKERDFVKSREKLATMQGRAQQYRLPPSIRYGEGNGYNIINQEPKKTVVKNNSSVADRGLSKRTRGRQAHEENIRQHERAAAISEQRALNRPSHQRHVEVLRTGHNVISNRIFTGREGKPPPEPRAKPPVPVWDRLSRQSGQPEAGGAASRKTRGQEGNQREEEGSSASPTTAQKGSGGGEDLRDRGGNNDHSRRRVGVEADSGDPGNEQGSHLSPGAETGADAGRSTMALQEASHSKPTVPPLDLPLQPS
eukprot:g6205.t1